MLGLLGTVTGMIEVFDVMAISGSGNARGMAGGVSQATLPTMAGMVAALSGMIFSIQLGSIRPRRSGSGRRPPRDRARLRGCDATRRRRDDEDDSAVNLTPMLDVVFIMLIFFIVTASFVKEAGIDVNASRRGAPPSARSAATSWSRSRDTARSGSTSARSIRARCARTSSACTPRTRRARW